MRTKLDGYKSNQRIIDIIKENKPFLITRVGMGGETIVSTLKFLERQIPSGPIHWFHNNAGFYGTTEYKRYSDLYKKACSDCDLHAYWSDVMFSPYEDILVPSNKTLIDPSALESFRFDDPWSSYLCSKKILVISPFKEEIDNQLLVKDKIWNNNILNGEFITYKSVQSIGGVGPHKDWYESFDIMCKDISEIDFDIALLGCGSYGLPLASFIRDMGKSAVYVGGGLQLYFGLIGKRWENSDDIKVFINDYWKRPNKNKNYEKVEGGCYW